MADNQNLMVSDLSEEEIQSTLSCAMNIRRHLERLIILESKVKYVNNLQILDTLISSYQRIVADKRLAI